MKTLRMARCGLAGAVLNETGGTTGRRRRRSRFASVLLALGLAVGSLFAQDPKPVVTTVAPEQPGNLSVSGPEQLADWQKRLTLGPGDSLNIMIFSQADSARQGLVIGPDGRLSYLQARDVEAAGKTIEELRAELEKILSKYHLAAQVVINPVGFQSKKYYILGTVQGRGVYPLDRPTTMIEAIAKAKGFVSAPQAQNVAMLVDLPRSFLVRKNPDGSFGRVAVDFEALFQRGDLKQNVALAPDDYLYFPPLAVQEVYVVGEVRSPGVVPFTHDMTALGAIASKGGFTEQAWKDKVLVIRGALTHPEPHVVKAGEILKAREKDFRLLNRDIVYVHKKPWAKPQELLEGAIMSFAQAAVIGYAGAHVGPFIKDPLIK